MGQLLRSAAHPAADLLRGGAHRQPAGRPGAVAAGLPRVVGAARPAGPLARGDGVDLLGLVWADPGGGAAAGAAAGAPRRGQPPLHRRRTGLPAGGGAGGGAGQHRPGALRGDHLVDGLHLRLHRRGVARGRRPRCGPADADALRAAALPGDGRPLAARRGAGRPCAGGAAALDRHPGAHRLHGDPLPLHGQDPLHVVAAPRRCGLHGLRLHAAGPAGRRPAPAARPPALRLVLRPPRAGSPCRPLCSSGRASPAAWPNTASRRPASI